MHKPNRSDIVCLFAILLTVFAVSLPRTAAAQDAEPAHVLAQQYQLDVTINGQPTGLIAAFTDLGNGRFAATAKELGEIGIIAPVGVKTDDVVPLDTLPGLTYVYDEAKQSLAIETGDQNRIRQTFNGRGELDQADVTPSNYGAVLNYSLYGSFGAEDPLSTVTSSDFSGVNATLDGRLISPMGVIESTAIIGMTLANETDTLRLDTTYTYTDDENLVRWRAGDFISGGTAWSRPIRMGGVQAQRAFGVRPDLVKSPLPSVSGSAAVPSSVDVYINGIKSYSKEVAAGPYQIENIPTVSGAGVAQVVTRDAAGRETTQSVTFYNSPKLLKPGLMDFSAETGVSRAFYGIESNNYGDELVASGTLRAGITDWLTAEAHGEASNGLVNGGAGVIANIANRGLISIAASGSTSDRGTGIQLYGSFETRIGNVSINGRSQHAFDNYDDLASLTNRQNPYRDGLLSIGVPGISSGLFSYAPPRAIDSLTVSTPLKFDNSTVSATYLRYETDDSDASEIVTATYSRPLFAKANMHATGFMDVNDPGNAGFFVGMSMSLDGNVSTNAGLSGRGGNYGAQVSASKPVASQPGSWGWRVNAIEDSAPYRSGTVGYRAEAARLEAGLVQDSNGVRATAAADGALAMIGGDIYASNHIDDAFAVVDVHEPNVKVERENVLVGTTNEDGKILIPNLTAYQKNKIAIDPMDLPLNAEPATTYDYVKPGFRSGVYVDFDVKRATPSAIVILKTADGKFVPVGSEGQLDGSDEPFVVGHEGQAYIKDLKAINSIHVSGEFGQCSTQFPFAPSSDVQPIVGPETCQ